MMTDDPYELADRVAFWNYNEQLDAGALLRSLAAERDVLRSAVMQDGGDHDLYNRLEEAHAALAVRTREANEELGLVLGLAERATQRAEQAEADVRAYQKRAADLERSLDAAEARTPEPQEDDRPIPDAVVEQVWAEVTDRRQSESYGDVPRCVLEAIEPLHGPGPSGEWGRWELVGHLSKEYGFQWLRKNYAGVDDYQPVYRFTEVEDA